MNKEKGMFYLEEFLKNIPFSLFELYYIFKNLVLFHNSLCKHPDCLAISSDKVIHLCRN